MATIVSADPALQAWVRSVFNELRPGIDTQDFDNWLVDGGRDKVAEIARMLHNRGDPRSVNFLPVKDLSKAVNAFIISVFYLKLSLSKNLGPRSPTAYLHREAGIRTFITCIQNETANHFATTEEEREEEKPQLLRILAARSGELLPIWFAIGKEHSLLKPAIGHRVALMHGTTKARWEREARAF